MFEIKPVLSDPPAKLMKVDFSGHVHLCIAHVAGVSLQLLVGKYEAILDLYSYS